jgi:RNA polymerase sigma factor (sigma-70 family)
MDMVIRGGIVASGTEHVERQVLVAGKGAQPTNAELLQRFITGRDGEAFAQLVRRHGEMVLGVCHRLLPNDQDTEDAFQATFLVLAQKARSIREVESVDKWLNGVAYRTARRARAQAARRRGLEERARAMAGQDPVNEAAGHDLRSHLDEEVGRLPDKYRALIRLCYLEGKSNAEAARELGCTKGTVSGRLARARELLRVRLARRGLSVTQETTPVVIKSGGRRGLERSEGMRG